MADAENRLIEVVPAEDDPNELTGDGKKLEFTYDYMGRRVEKAVYAWDPNATDWESDPELRRRFVWSDWLLVLELDATDPNDVTILRKYTWGLDVAAGACGHWPSAGQGQARTKARE